MMQRKPLSDQHCVKLAEYGLQAIPLDSCVCLKFHAGETILQEGMPITYLFVVVSGSAKVCSTARNGKNLVLCYYICEGLMGDLELMILNALPYLFSAMPFTLNPMSGS